MTLTQQQRQELKAAVEKGAAFLDTVDPNWRTTLRQTIDETTTLRMDDCHSCVLAYLFDEEYEDALGSMLPDLSDDELKSRGQEYGFSLPTHDGIYSRDPNVTFLAWRYLRDCWLAKIGEESHA